MHNYESLNQMYYEEQEPYFEQRTLGQFATEEFIRHSVALDIVRRAATRAKDIDTIRLMGQSVQTKYSQMAFENKLKSQDLTFGGYTSVIAGLTTGYGTAKYYKT